MTASAPWSVKGIDSKAREAAKDMARRSGMTLGEWLNQMILEGDGVAGSEAPVSPAARSPERAPPSRAVSGRGAARDGLSRDAFAKGVRRPAVDLDAPYADDADELSRVTAALDTLTARIEFAESRSATAVSGINRAVETVLSRLEDTDAVVAEARDRFEGAAEQGREAARQHAAVLESQSKLAERLIGTERISVAHAERLEGLSAHLKAERERIARIEQEIAHPRSLEAVRTMEVALGKLANQLYEGDTRTRASLSDVREDLAGLSARVGAVEGRDGDARMRAMVEGVVAQVAQRLEMAEARTTGALRTLESSFAALDARLTQAEARGDVTDPEDLISPRETLTRLAEDLTRRVDLARAEMLERLDTTSQVRFDRVDRALADLNAHIGDVEKQSARAIERMGQDVLRIADNLNRKVSGVEASSAEAMARVGGDVRRLAEIMDSRLGQSEGAHSQALEKLGTEIARISEKLTVRIADTERRTARAIDELSDQLGGAAEAMDARYARTSTDLAERIRQSEERTARTLQEARERIESRLAAVQVRPETRSEAPTLSSLVTPSDPITVAPAMQRSEPRPDPLTFPEEFGPLPSAFAPAPIADKVEPSSPFDQDAGPEDALLGSDPFEADDQGIIHGAIPTQAPRSAEIAFDGQDEADLSAAPISVGVSGLSRFEAHEDDDDLVPSPHAQSLKPAHDPFDDEDASSDAALAAELKALAGEIGDLPPEPFGESASEMVPPPVLARAAPALKASDAETDEDLFADPQPVLSTRDALAAARAAVRSSLPTEEERSAGFLSGLKLGKSKTKLRDFGAPEDKGKNSTLLRAFKASAVAVALTTVAVSSAVIFGDDIRSFDPGSTGKDKTPQPDKATGQIPLAATAVTPLQSDAAIDPVVLARDYQAATEQLKNRDAKGVEVIRRLANLGYAPAQFHLGRLHEGEAGGLVKTDPVEARRWTERAAQGGDPRAMHNLGLMLFSGTGGPQDPTTAAQWFRKAADRGIVDSQFNLGVMYQDGTGLPLDPAEAYKWLMIASRNGDREATKAAKNLVSRLEPAQESAARLAADRFQPITEIPAASGSEKVAMR